MGHACSTRSKGSDRGPVRIRMHPARGLHSAPKHLRDAQCVSWFPLGHYPFPHARAVERLPAGYPPVDQLARRPDGSDDMAASSKHLPLLSQVLNRTGVSSEQRTAPGLSPWPYGCDEVIVPWIVWAVSRRAPRTTATRFHAATH
jgi:hypothetical protein